MNRRQNVSESPWTYAQKSTDTAAQWQLTWTWPPVSHAQAETLSAWLLSLKGQTGSFRYSPRQRYAYATTGLTLALPGYAFNDTISVKGWGAGAPTGLRAGQYFTIGTQLLRIVQAAAFADGAGAATIVFESFLRQTIAANTAVNFTAPFGVFRLATSDGLDPTLTPDRILEFGPINAREVV